MSERVVEVIHEEDGRARANYCGVDLGTSSAPLAHAAAALLETGLADEADDVVIVRRDGSIAERARVGQAARERGRS